MATLPGSYPAGAVVDLNRPPVAVFVLIPVLIPVPPFCASPQSSRTQLSCRSRPICCWAASLAFDGKELAHRGASGFSGLGDHPNETRKADVSLQAVAREGRCVRCHTPRS